METLAIYQYCICGFFIFFPITSYHSLHKRELRGYTVRISNKYSRYIPVIQIFPHLVIFKSSYQYVKRELHVPCIKPFVAQEGALFGAKGSTSLKMKKSGVAELK